MTEFERQQKKDQIKQKVENTKNWVKAHPMETALIIAAGASTISGISRNIRRHRINKAERIKARSLYDPHTGMTWKLKRPLTNEEKVFILHNAKMGYDYHNSLMYLDLLPKR